MRKKRRHERSEGKRGRRKRASEGEEKGRSVGGREIGREGNFKGGTARDMGIAVIPPAGSGAEPRRQTHFGNYLLKINLQK